MRIAELRIENFRGIKHGEVHFGRHSVLVGANNSGKTTIIEALVLLFGRDRLIRTLTEHDFYGGSPKAADRIRIIATVTDFEPNDPAEHRNWFIDGHAIEKWYDPATNKLHDEPKDDQSKLACQLAFCARFDLPLLEVETIRYFHDDEVKTDPFEGDSATSTPRRLIQELGFFLVPANRTWDAVISFGSELFRRVVTTAQAQPSESVIAERDRLRRAEGQLEADTALAGIVANLNQELAGFLRSEPQLRLRLTSTDSEGVLDAVVAHYAFADGGLPLPARRHGSGLVSLQRVLLLLHLGRLRADNGENFWMALEEPELHVPPPLQRRLVTRLQALSSQTFISTHSPMVAALADPRTVSVLRNDRGVLQATPLLMESLPSDTANSVRKLFQLHRLDTISALMHEVVVVPEGSIDKEWLDLLSRAIDATQGWNSDQECHFASYLGLVPTQDGAVVATFQALQRLHPQIMILVDGDAAGLGYATDLLQCEAPPSVIVRWPDHWTIEDTVGWILSVAESSALAELKETIAPPLASIADLVTRLKTTVRTGNGLKQDRVAYEAIADVIGRIGPCTERARRLLNAICELRLGKPTEHFASDPNMPKVSVLQP